MNILFTRSFKSLRMGGVTLYVKQLITHLDSTKFKVINLIGMNKKHFLNTKELTTWSNISIKIDLLFFLLSFPFKFFKYEVDIVHANPSLDFKGLVRDGCFLLIAKMFRKKTVVFIHGWDKKTEKKIQSNYMLRNIFKKVYNRSDIIIVLATEFKQILKTMGFTNKIIVETTMADDAMIPEDKVVSKLKRPKIKSVKLLFLSRIEKSKGVFEAIETFMLLNKKYEDIELYIAGDGPDLPAVTKYVNSLGCSKIELLGYVSGARKQKAFIDSDIFLFPTYYGEGMPISLLEAMAYGNAIVTRRVGGIPDIFKNELNGFITDSMSPDVFADYIERLLDDRALLHKICLNNFEYAKQNFLSSKVTKRMESIYLTL